jgi:hypothetical protein
MSARHASRTAAAVVSTRAPIASRALAAWLVATLGVSVGMSRARAADETGACVAAYERSQVLRRDHKLGRAREELRVCARAACPALVRNDCVNWLDQVQTAFPSLAIRAVKDGNDVAKVRVTQDNEVVATRLDGTSLEVEPGEHGFRFETDGAAPVTMTVVVREGEKDRVVPVAFVSPHHRAAGSEAAPGDAGPSSRPIPVGVFVLGGVGVAGIATFAALGSIGKSDENSLRTSCSPNCSPGAIDKVRTEYVAADVGLGVGAAALVAAGVWYMLRPGKTEAAPAPQDGLVVAPGRGGAAIEWTGRF